VDDFVALETLVVPMDLAVKILDQTFWIDEELLLWNEHSVEASHVKDAQLGGRRAVIAEEAVQQRVGLSLGGCRGLLVFSGGRLGLGSRKRMVRLVFGC
jgi:hypothetical protein